MLTKHDAYQIIKQSEDEIMDDIISIAVAIVCFAFFAGAIIYGLRFSRKQGNIRWKSKDRFLRFGILGAMASLIVDTIISAAKSLYPDDK